MKQIPEGNDSHGSKDNLQHKEDAVEEFGSA